MAELKTVELGNTEQEASVIGYGTYHLMDKLDPLAAIESLGTAFEAGITLFDTSDNYGTELAIGRAVQEGILPRDEIVIATKTGLATSASEAIAWGEKSADTSSARIRQQVEKSLWLLGDDAGPIDLYQLHVHDPEVTAIENAATMTQLINEGKIGAYGVSNYTTEQLSELLEVCDTNGFARPATLQSFQNILTDFGNQYVIDLARSEDMTVLAHSPLHKGALTGGAIELLDDVLASVEEANPAADLLREGLDSLKDLQEYASRCGRSLPTLAIAWLAMQNNTVVLTACTTPEYVAEATDATNWQVPSEGLEFIEAVQASMPPLFTSRLLSIIRNTKLYYR